MIAVGYAKHSDPATAVRRCVAALGPAPARLLLAFVGGKLDPHAVLAALRRECGEEVPIHGGSAAGAIAREGYGYSGFELGLIAFRDPEVTPRALVTRQLLPDERAAGAVLGDEVRSQVTRDAVVLLLFDSVASSAPLRLHHASSIVEGFHAGFGDAPLHLLGGGLLTDMNLTGGWVYDGREVVKHAAVALVFPPGIAAETAIMHGCRPVSTFMEITRIDGADVYELDGKPALAVIERMLGLPLGGAKGHELSLVATLGQKQGDPFAPYDENAYVNRLILRAAPETGAVTLFEPDFALGTQVQIMSRDNSLMLESVRRGVAAINSAIAGGDNLLGLYIDCAGRGSARSGAPVEEAELVARGLDAGTPFLGFYSGVEVAPFAGGPSKPLDWTGVLTVLRSARA
ncbi:FIST C-terminal domain-containing protein [Siccirubricoccus sp. KC 17139]|uniref:FIST C-terminal domain-containing protein n=1 Tax=Siccirubricoccus soli TaxID=2899147 RepID=A0ABT1DBU6_9PROT|nr:FIST C-terminal domain-containing protein [Siccirubricoccus soli]MCP2685192.1 FIST C-terminal domain-containing protein [Siccirubricoccus soli]